MIQENVSVVLVETQQPGNIGSAARAMHNMGLRRLKLVNPAGRLNQECQKMAGKAMDLVLRAEVCQSLGQAVADDHLVVGTSSARDRKSRQRVHTPREIAPLLLEQASRHKIALVFGPERGGLTEEQLALCQYQVSIPADPGYPVLNLAQAVLILCYELFLASPLSRPGEELQLASQEEREQMYAHIEKVLLAVGFLSSGNPGHIMRSIRRFLGKAELTYRDVRIVRGIMAQMEWYAREGHRLPPEKLRKD
jgi:tRNA/rRNA methyltransferase